MFKSSQKIVQYQSITSQYKLLLDVLCGGSLLSGYLSKIYFFKINKSLFTIKMKDILNHLFILRNI